MSYPAPSGSMDVSWSGADSYTAGSSPITGAWTSVAYVSPSAISKFGAGSASLALGQLYVTPSGIVPGNVAARVRAGNKTTAFYASPQFEVNASWLDTDTYTAPSVTKTGSWSANQSYISASSAGTGAKFGATAVTQQQFITPGGFNASAVGEGYALFGWQYAPPEWTLDASWPGEDTYAAPILPINAAWTIPSDEDVTVALVGQDELKVSSGITVVRMRDYLEPSGLDVSAVFGTTGFTNWRTYAKPSGVALSAAGVPSLEMKNRTVKPSAITTLALGSVTVQGKIRTLAVTGISTLAWGTPGFVNKNKSITPGGISLLWIGSLTVQAAKRSFTLSGIASLAMGAPTLVMQKRSISAGAINTIAYGTPKLELKTRYLPLAGFGLLGVGAPTIELRNRFLTLTGFNASALGSGASATLEVRHLYTSGVSLLAASVPWVSDSPRYVEVGAGPKTSAFGTPTMGFGRQITPFGWDGLRFGTRIIPEVQYCYPRGMSGAFGETRIWTRTQTVSPAGFLPDVQEAYRWGASKVWNWARFITQYAQTDDSTSLNPPAMSKYVTVENRNRTIATFATDPHPLPSPAIVNNGRPALPAGIAAPAITVKMVSHRVRTYRLDGIDSIRFEKTHAIYNAARVLVASGLASAGYGSAASVVNTRRSFTIYSYLNSLAMGSPMVAYRVRTLSFKASEGIEPPTLKGPEVKLWRRYVAPTGFDRLGWEAPSLRIHWTIFYPDGIRAVAYGSPTVRNKTPQLYAYGHDSRLFGTPAVRTQWRRYALDGVSSLIFGNTVIRDRRQWISPSGVNRLLMGTKLRAEKMTEDAPVAQKVFAGGLETLKFDGTVALNQQVVYAAGFSALSAGSPDMQANSIRMDSGAGSFAYGTPTVSLWIRTLTPDSIGHSPEFDTSNYPRMSPWTIWAPAGAPEQAQTWGGGGAYIDVGGDSKNPGIKLGSPIVTNHHRFLTASSLGTLTAAGTPALTLRRQYIKPSGYAPSRYGYHALGPFTQTVEQLGDDVETPDTTYGAPTVTIHYTGPQTVAGQGLDLGRMGALDIENFNRRVYPTGWNSASLGASDKETAGGYAWQTLHVGLPMPTIPAGWDSQSLGTGWVSLKVREVRATGFDAFTSDYTLDAFDSRLKVKQAAKVIASQTVKTNGLTTLTVATPDIKLKTQYIRPDGNAETYRKGAPLS